jgi:hypothetical protein
MQNPLLFVTQTPNMWQYSSSSSCSVIWRLRITQLIIFQLLKKLYSPNRIEKVITAIIRALH